MLKYMRGRRSVRYIISRKTTMLIGLLVVMFVACGSSAAEIEHVLVKDASLSPCQSDPYLAVLDALLSVPTTPRFIH